MQNYSCQYWCMRSWWFYAGSTVWVWGRCSFSTGSPVKIQISFKQSKRTTEVHRKQNTWHFIGVFIYVKFYFYRIIVFVWSSRVPQFLHIIARKVCLTDWLKMHLPKSSKKQEESGIIFSVNCYIAKSFMAVHACIIVLTFGYVPFENNVVWVGVHLFCSVGPRFWKSTGCGCVQPGLFLQNQIGSSRRYSLWKKKRYK